MESTESWRAMMDALAGRPPNRGRALWLEDRGPGSRAAIVRHVRAVIEQRTVPKDGTSPEHLAETITTSVLNRLGASNRYRA